MSEHDAFREAQADPDELKVWYDSMRQWLTGLEENPEVKPHHKLEEAWAIVTYCLWPPQPHLDYRPLLPAARRLIEATVDPARIVTSFDKHGSQAGLACWDVMETALNGQCPSAEAKNEAYGQLTQLLFRLTAEGKTPLNRNFYSNSTVPTLRSTVVLALIMRYTRALDSVYTFAASPFLHREAMAPEYNVGAHSMYVGTPENMVAVRLMGLFTQGMEVVDEVLYMEVMQILRKINQDAYLSDRGGTLLTTLIRHMATEVNDPEHLLPEHRQLLDNSSRLFAAPALDWLGVVPPESPPSGIMGS